MSELSLADKLIESKIEMPENTMRTTEQVNPSEVNKTADPALPSNEPVIGDVPDSIFDIKDQSAFHNEINISDKQRKTKERPKKALNPNIKKHAIKAVKVIGLIGSIAALSYGGWSYLENRQKLTVQEDTLSNGQINLEMKFNKLEVKFYDSQAQANAALAKLKAKLVEKDNRLKKVLTDVTGRMDSLTTEIKNVKTNSSLNGDAIFGLTVEAGNIKKLLAGIKNSISKLNLSKVSSVEVASKRTKPKRSKQRGPVTINNINGYKLYSVDTISGRNKIVLIKGNAIRIIRKGEEFEGFSVKSSSRDTQMVSLRKNSRTYKLISG
ncbi:MAG: hypothetical protein HRU38_06775 [Saccharospirillaceae bacterium]|nr:hypothetical protein [Saccharospirillaceae bacterium]